MTAPTELDERALPWTTETDLPYGQQPRIYDANGTLVAVVGNAEIEKQDDWERNAEAIVRAVNSLPASEAGWREMPAPDLERVVVAGWHPARQMTRGYWWYHEDCTDDAGKPMDHPEATLWLPLSDLLPAFPSAPDRRPA